MSNSPETGFADALQQFHMAWETGSPPPLREFFGLTDDADYVRRLIALDMEFRWCKLSGLSDAGRDETGLPDHPLLEDYARLLGNAASFVFTAQLVATEYRVRLRYGDRPSRGEFATRFPQATDGLSVELDRAEREARIETPTVSFSVGSSRAAGEQSSVGLVGSLPRQPPLKRIGKYETIRLLGRGGFGEVWLAEHPQLKRPVAIKTPRRDRQFSSSQLEDFLRESQKLASLDQIAGVVRVFDADEEDGIPYIVTDYIDGENLSERLRRDAVTPFEAAEIVASLAQTLHRAHLRGLTHRDVKPENILLDKQGAPYLTDLGLSITEHDLIREQPATLGTLGYMSPEQARGDSHLVDGRTDIYSLGAVFYLMLTQRLPFSGESAEGYIRQILAKEPRPPRMINDQIPEELERVCLKCLRKSVSERYTTAGDLAVDLRKAAMRRKNQPSRLAFLVTGAALVLSWVAGAIAWPYMFSAKKAPVSPSGSSAPLRPGVMPATLLSSAPSENTYFRVDEATNRLHLVSNDLQLIKLGTLDQTDAVIEIAIETSALKSESGHAGVFIGYGDRADHEQRQFQYIRLEALSDQESWSRRTISYFHPQTPASRSAKGVSSVPLKAAARVNTITLNIVGGRLHQLRWNGQLAEDVELSTADSVAENDVTGAFGVYVNQSVAVFSSFRVNGELQEFQLLR